MRTSKVVGALAIVAAMAAATTTAGASQQAVLKHRFLPMSMLGPVFGSSFDLAPPPAGQTPEQRAAWLLSERPALGRTPMDWVRFSREAFSLDLPADAPAHAALATNVLRLYAAAGIVPSGTDQLAIAANAARVPAAMSAPFSDLVGAVADAYAVQGPLSKTIVARKFDPRMPLVTPAERDVMTQLQSDIVRAVNVFRARTTTAAPRVGEPLAIDPEGLVVLGSAGDDRYTRSGMFPDPILLVDPSGNDRYENSAGGACPLTPESTLFGDDKWLDCNGLALSVVADLGGNDVYSYDGPPAAVQGAGGPGGLGVLLDVAGDDVYFAQMTRADTYPIFQYVDGGAQGFGYGGAGLLLDGAGDDVWRFDSVSRNGMSIWTLGQGFGGAGGIGIASDVAGKDSWVNESYGLVGDGFQGIYTQGTGLYAGIGIMTDTGGGDDIYRSVVTAQTVDYYAQGFGAFGGVGIMYEDGGNDDYYTLEEATGPSWIDPLLNCAFGTASFGGVGIMVDVAGNDTYYGASRSPTGASVMDNGFGGPGVAYGLFADFGGDDRYVMEAFGNATMIQGRGLWEPVLPDPDTRPDPFESPAGHNTWGTFVDIGGNDTYVGGPGANDSQWPFGVDHA